MQRSLKPRAEAVERDSSGRFLAAYVWEASGWVGVGPLLLTLNFQSRECPSASDFSVSESQVDKKWRKQMVGLKFLFARLAWKESFPQGVSASDLLFCSEENSLSRSEPAWAPVSGHGLEEMSRQLRKRVQGAWVGKVRFLTFPVMAPRAVPSVFALPSLVDVGLHGSVSARPWPGACRPYPEMRGASGEP